MTDDRPEKYRFDEFELDLAKRRLLRDGEVVALKPKVFDLLTVLVENNGRLVTKDDIFQQVWGDQFVEETNLTVSISAIRRALGETASEPRYITNISGRGYYFNAEIGTNGDVMVESRSFSRIVVEEDEPRLPELPPGTAKRWWPALVGVVGVLLVGLAVYALFFRDRTNGAAAFQAFSVTRLTTSGRVTIAAVSPDGQAFAYAKQELDGANSIWVSRLDGTEPIQLRAPGKNSIAALNFAPKGDRVYFVEADNSGPRNGTLYRVPVLGGFTEKLRDGVPALISLSPDGTSFAYVTRDAASRTSRLVVSEIDGKSERELTSVLTDAGTFGYAVAWSLNGEFVAVANYLNQPSPELCEIFVVSVKDGSMRQITNKGWKTVRSMAWTKDSDGILAAAGDGTELDRQIWYVPFPTGEPQKLLADSNAYTSISLSTDNATALAIQTQSISNIWVAPANDLSAARQITFDMLGKQSGWNSVDWTNDGRVVFTGRTSQSDIVSEAAADGTGIRQVLPEGKRIESVSLPDDGSFLVFTSNRSGSLEIWRAARNGTDLVQLSNGGYDENAHVSPDGRYIVYRAGRGPDGRLMRMTSTGAEPTALTDRLADWARVSPDSSLIACGYDIGGAMKLAVLSIDGGPPQKVFDVPETANFRLGVRWTPDGSAVTYRDWQNGIWKQDLNGGEPVRLAGLPQEKLFAYAWSRDGKWFAYGRGSAISDVVLLSNLK